MTWTIGAKIMPMSFKYPYYLIFELFLIFSRSIRARLGEQVVVEEQEIEVARKRKKTVSSGNFFRYKFQLPLKYVILIKISFYKQNVYRIPLSLS